jgi:serine/threonine-protein kinase
MGVVYRAFHIYIRKSVAVKVLHRHFFQQPGAKARFLAEAQAASLVDHPNIVGVTDFGEAPDGTVYLVMSEARGTGLDLVLEQEGTLPLFRAIGILNQVTRALSAVHARGIIHRDVKPENIMLARKSGRRKIVRQMREGIGYAECIEPEECFDLVTLLDFGAARMLQPHVPASGESGRVFGTPAYLAPETAQTGSADARSDVYSVGIVFYEMLTGELPFDGETSAITLDKQISEPPQPPRQRNPNVEITPEAERVIMRCLEKDPARRPASMDELWRELQCCYGVMQWCRPMATPPDGTIVKNLRAPLVGSLTLANTQEGTADAADHTEAQHPLLLTRRKSGSHHRVVFPEDTPTPPPTR